MKPQKAKDISQDELEDSMGSLYAALNEAYWAASTIESKDRIRGAQDLVFDILTSLNVADIKARSSDYTALKGQFTVVQKKLDGLKSDIDEIIHTVTVATKVTDAIGKSLKTISGFTGM